jgi:putative zinc finger protein
MAHPAEVHVVSEPRSEHLTPIEVASYVDGVADPDVRARMDTHLAECGDCRDEIVDASRIASAWSRNTGRHAAIWIPLAAAAVLVFILVGPNSVRDRELEHREAPVTTTVLPRAIAPVGVTDSLPQLLWTSVPNTDRYQVRLFAADGSVLWEQATTDTSAIVPATVGLQAGRAYYWKVEAHTGFDRSAASELTEFSFRHPRRQ